MVFHYNDKSYNLTLKKKFISEIPDFKKKKKKKKLDV